MKPVPLYWNRHHQTVTFRDGTSWEMTITGSSLISEQDAAVDAQRRLAQFVAAANTRGGAPQDWYYPDRRLPEHLLEEIHNPDGQLIVAVTRNRYGAEVLNTDAVMITDIDLRIPPAPKPGKGGLLSRLFGRSAPDPGADWSTRVQQEESRITGLIHVFSNQHPHLGIHTYRTHGGFRVFVTGADAPPQSQEAARIMRELSSDELYMTLCRVQDSYRARLTPKPWRVNVRRNSYNDPGWGGTDELDAWVRGYDAASAQYAVCRLVGRTGPAPSSEEQRIIELHDRATSASSDRPLA